VVDRMYTTVPYTSEALLALLGGLMPPFSRVSSYEEVAATGWPRLLAENGYATAFFTGSYLNEKRGERRMLMRLGFETVVGAEDLSDDQASLRTYSGVDDFSIMPPALSWVDSVLADSARFVLACLTQSSHHPYELPSDVALTPTSVDDRELGLYLNTLAYVDEFLRTFYDELRRRDLLESTVLLIVGDHGESFGEHGARFHGMNVWEQGVRVPFLLHDPSSGHSRRVAGPFQQTDVLATVLESAGFALRGVDPVARSVLTDPPHSKVYLASAGSQSMALVTDTLKYVYHYRRRPMQVFDLTVDPFETEDLAGRLSRDLLRDVELELLLWEAAVNAQEEAPRR
jgi:arylsulfatase A-like enzyme